MNDVNCPYCDAEQDINHDDGVGYEENVRHEQQCNACGKTFTYTTSISFYYEAEKADCLNGGEHDFHPTTTYPKEFTMMECSMCDESRKPNEEEMRKILEPKVQEGSDLKPISSGGILP